MIHRGEEQILLQDAPLTIPGTLHTIGVRGGHYMRSPSNSSSSSSSTSSASAGVVLDLALSQLQRYAATCDLVALTNAIRDFRALSVGLGLNSDELADLQSVLCAALRQMYERTGDQTALAEAASMGELSVLVVYDASSFGERAVTFAHALFAQFSLTGQVNYLNRAGALLDHALLVVQGTEMYDIVATCLAECLRVRSLALNDGDALIRALMLFSSTSGQMTDITLVTYALCLQQRYYRFREDSDLALAIALCEGALTSTSPGPLVRAAVLTATSVLYATQVGNTNNQDDLGRAIDYGRQGLTLVHDFATCWPRVQVPLALMELHRYMWHGNAGELTGVFSNLEKVLAAIPENGIERASALHVAAVTYLYRFDVCGRTVDLDSMVHFARQCVSSTTFQRVRYHASLMLLSASVRIRYRYLHRGEDLAEFLDLAKTTVNKMPAGYPASQASCIGNLGIAEHAADVENRGTALLDRAITDLHRSIDLRADGTWGKSELFEEFFALGEAYLARAEQTKMVSDWSNGFQAFEQCLQYSTRRHTRRTRALVAPAIGQRKLFLATGQGDLDESLQLLREALECTPLGLPTRARVLIEYGHTSMLLYRRNPQQVDHMKNAWNAWRTAAHDFLSYVRDRFDAVRLWVQLASEQKDYKDAVDASAQALLILPRFPWIGMDHEARIKELKAATLKMGNQAASAAIELGACEEAVEFLDDTQTIFWTQLRALRGEFHELQLVAPALGKELEEVGRAMEVCETEQSLSVKAALDRRRRSVDRWDSLVREVRKVTGMERFLLPARFGLLRQAAFEVPIVVLNISRERPCDALVITYTHRVQHLQLSGFTMELAKEMHSMLVKAAGAKSDRPGRMMRENAWVQVLDRLWQVFGQPLVNTLARLFPSGPPSRIRLCPIGVVSLLPLHAAMPRGTQQRGFADLFCCSYISSIATLLRSQRCDNDYGMQRLLAVSVPLIPNYPLLARAKDEKRILQTLHLQTPPTFMDGAEATIESVCSAMTNYEWIHLAVRGDAIALDAMSSGLYLHDGPLTLSRIAQLGLHKTKFAFLSACQFTPSSAEIPEECLPLAAGLHFAGIDGLIATMGEVVDKDASEVARMLYAYMTSERQIPSHEDAAEGLKRAITSLRRQNVPISRWAPFVHVG
ncbi:hypothetical protein DACRYDRAFT_105474 [Dacryopinax primogenitus]|uniref:CHAT domain-containing protein n=1 Tax=Dacryopinax primogenitus (strain DJM 731) TaxID=1858805 RepID=M5G8D4_DACPD|nr:uncharacterized protein DACRYDRAFT_105474 [Dacryopinax primogenitus]EJU04415.1 hypothetical protein DACRYDRAFT_105474 [Dacryopinax primogenitus]